MGNILSQQEQEPSYSQEEIDELLNNYVVKNDLANFARTSDFDKFAGKSDLDSYQPKGDYVAKGDLASYQPKGEYVAKSDLASYQPKGEYAAKSDLGGYALANHNHDADLKTKTMWCATGDVCEVPANKYVHINNIRFSNNWSAYSPNGGNDKSEISNDTSDYKQLMIVGNSSSGVRTVGIWDKLNVNGNLDVTGTLSIGGKKLDDYISAKAVSDFKEFVIAVLKADF